jgi:secretion/DNA translocation related TadE-like protein
VIVVMVIAMVAVLLAVAAVAAGVAALQVRTSQAADLAALAGAEKALSGEVAACAEASRIAAAHGTSVQRCSWEGLDVQVHVSLPLRLPFSGAGVDPPDVGWRLSAVARAGPPDDLGLG